MLDIPLSALPGKAKFVVRQYQYEKRDHETAARGNDDEDEEEYSEEEEVYIKRNDSPQQASLTEFLGQSAPDATTWIRLAQESLSSLQTSPDPIGALQNCQNVRENIMRLIESETSLPDETLAGLLGQLEALNVVL